MSMPEFTRPASGYQSPRLTSPRVLGTGRSPPSHQHQAHHRHPNIHAGLPRRRARPFTNPRRRHKDSKLTSSARSPSLASCTRSGWPSVPPRTARSPAGDIRAQLALPRTKKPGGDLARIPPPTLPLVATNIEQSTHQPPARHANARPWPKRHPRPHTSIGGGGNAPPSPETPPQGWLIAKPSCRRMEGSGSETNKGSRGMPNTYPLDTPSHIIGKGAPVSTPPWHELTHTKLAKEGIGQASFLIPVTLGVGRGGRGIHRRHPPGMNERFAQDQATAAQCVASIPPSKTTDRGHRRTCCLRPRANTND